jgi:hypothetical protein
VELLVQCSLTSDYEAGIEDHIYRHHDINPMPSFTSSACHDTFHVVLGLLRQAASHVAPCCRRLAGRALPRHRHRRRGPGGQERRSPKMPSDSSLRSRPGVHDHGRSSG